MKVGEKLKVSYLLLKLCKMPLYLMVWNVIVFVDINISNIWVYTFWCREV